MTPRSNKQLEILCLKLQITITLWAYLSSRVPRSLKLAGVTCWTKVSTSSVIVTWKIPNPKQVIIQNGLNYLLKKDSSFRAPPSYIHWELPCNRVIHAPVAFMQWYLSWTGTFHAPASSIQRHLCTFMSNVHIISNCHLKNSKPETSHNTQRVGLLSKATTLKFPLWRMPGNSTNHNTVQIVANGCK